jgi:UDP-N-acetylglucosamine acyltransferase
MTSIHPDAKISNKVAIEAFSSIAADVEIGEGTWIGPNVSIMDGARIGKNCKIFPGAVISAEPQDLKYNGELTYARIGDGTVIRESATVNKGTIAKGETVVGNNCLLMANSHVGHDCILGNHVILVNSVGLAGEVIIEDYAILAGLVGVHQFVRIGTHAFVQGGSMVGMDIPPFVTAGRNPTKFAGINTIGLRRRGFESEIIRNIQEAYRIIYNSGLNNTLALQKVSEEIKGNGEIQLIIDFITASKRGIIGN